jgi:hypothetical protein
MWKETEGKKQKKKTTTPLLSHARETQYNT